MGQRTPPVIREWVSRVRERFPCERVLLFGSRARGQALASSDWDVLFVSSGFAGLSPHQRVVAVLRLLPAALPVDPICLTPAEFAERSEQVTVVRQAAREGVELAA